LGENEEFLVYRWSLPSESTKTIAPTDQTLTPFFKPIATNSPTNGPSMATNSPTNGPSMATNSPTNAPSMATNGPSMANPMVGIVQKSAPAPVTELDSGPAKTASSNRLTNAPNALTNAPNALPSNNPLVCNQCGIGPFDNQLKLESHKKTAHPVKKARRKKTMGDLTASTDPVPTASTVTPPTATTPITLTASPEQATLPTTPTTPSTTPSTPVAEVQAPTVTHTEPSAALAEPYYMYNAQLSSLQAFKHNPILLQTASNNDEQPQLEPNRSELDQTPSNCRSGQSTSNIIKQGRAIFSEGPRAWKRPLTPRYWRNPRSRQEIANNWAERGYINQLTRILN